MTPTQAELHQRIQAFNFDLPSAQFTFADKLARENEWLADLAQRAIVEYKRYAFLAVAAGYPVAPSPVVDEVWHLHMTYTQSYWNEFCPQVLGRPLHHYPSQGGASEQTKLALWYEETLRSYRTFFGAEPPADIWPSPAELAHRTETMVRINKADYWLIRKPTATQDTVATAPSVAAITLPEQLAVSDLHPYAVAQLADGKAQVLPTVVTSLIERGVLQPDATMGRFTVAQALPPEADPLDRTVISAVIQSGRATYGEISHAVYDSLPVQEIEQWLQSLGLVNRQSTAAGCLRALLTLGIAGSSLWLLGALLGGGAADQALVMLIACVISRWVLAYRPYRTQQGEEVLAQLRTALATRRDVTTEFPAVAQLATRLVALGGVAALAGNTLDPLHKLLTPKKEGGNSCGGGCGAAGCDSGCSGGGCGGGCGGG